MNIVLVHGFLDRSGIMSGLSRRLSSHGHTCVSPSLKPCDGRRGLVSLAEQLDRFIRGSFPEGARIALVGFSMGALLCRYYIQELEGHRRTEAFAAIAGPHYGTLTAYLYPGRGAREMRPGSAFLRRLEQAVDKLSQIQVTCYWSPCDPVVVPASSARMKGARHVRIWSPFHPVLPFDPRIYRDLEDHLRHLQAGLPRTGPA